MHSSLNSRTSKLVTDTIFNFSIDTDFCYSIYNPTTKVTSYTFATISENPKLQNLVVACDSLQVFKTYLMDYDINKNDFTTINPSQIPNIEVNCKLINFDATSLFNKCQASMELICVEDWGYVYQDPGPPRTGDADGGDVVYVGGGYVWVLQSSSCSFVYNEGCSGGGDLGTGFNTSPTNGTSGGGSGGGSTKTPCQQLKDNNSKPITNINPSKTVLDNLNDLTAQMSTNPRERMYVLFPTTTTENQYEETYTEGPLNGGDAELNVSGIYISALMHCHYNTSLLSIFSLADIYLMYNLQSSGFLLNNGETFTSYLVTAHGTKYAIRFAPQDPNSLTNYNEFFFAGWEFDNFKDAKEKLYKNYVKTTNTPELNELGFLKFLKDQNLGIEIYKADATFAQWSKLTIGSNGQVKPVPCQ